MNLRTVLIAGMLGLSISACATPTVGMKLSDDTGRMGIEQVRLGQSRVDTLEQATGSLGNIPDCQSRKIFVKNSRRAYSHETCTYSDVSATLADVPLTLVSYHFIDDRLLRIDLKANGADQEMATLKDQLDGQFGRVAAVSEAKENVYRWQTAKDRAELWANANDGTLQLRIVDVDAAKRAF